MLKKIVVLVVVLMMVTSVHSVSAESARDYISIVGSSTVYPFATVVAEQFGKTTHFKTPKIESTGSGGGFKLFCAGVGVEHPDIINASRAIKSAECEKCLFPAPRRSRGATVPGDPAFAYRLEHHC